jgi:hypothetical protein
MAGLFPGRLHRANRDPVRASLPRAPSTVNIEHPDTAQLRLPENCSSDTTTCTGSRLDVLVVIGFEQRPYA